MIAGMEAEPQQPGDIAARSVRSSAYTVTGSIIQTAVGLVRMILLARLLDSVTFGAYTFAMSVVGITQSLPLFGMSSALLHRATQSEGENALRTHLTLNFLLNSVWAIIIAVAGPLFMIPEERWVLWVYLAAQYLINMSATASVVLMRRVVFRRITLVQTSSIIIGTISALILASNGYGLWALLSTDIAVSLISFFGYVIIRPGWHYQFGWSASTAKYLLGFGSKALSTHLLTSALERIDNLWIGHYLGQSTLGYYSRAYTFGTYPRKLLASPLIGVANSTYSALKFNKLQLSQAFFRVNAMLVRSGFMFSGALALVAPEFIRLVIGSKWLPMLDAFRLMLVFTMLDPLRDISAILFLAVGKPQKLIWARALQLGALIAGMYLLGPKLEISGVAIALTISAVIGVGTQYWLSRNYVEFSLPRLFGAPVLALMVGLILARAAILIPGVMGSDWRTGAVKLLVFSPIYLSVLFLMERNELPAMVKMLQKVLPKKMYTWIARATAWLAGV